MTSKTSRAAELTSRTPQSSAPATVGANAAERAKAAGVEKVAFDRGAYKFHGRVKAVADGAREGGLNF